MWGFIIAAECALGLLFIWMYRRAHRSRRGGMYYLFKRLDTTPGQEQVIRNVLSNFKVVGQKARDDARRARPELADLVRSETFDESAARSWIASRERTLSELKPSVLESLREIHGVLDPDQRKTLGEALEHPGFWLRGFGCGRRHAHYGGL
jgi:Spy/CpxP family protein refolding chaperone